MENTNIPKASPSRLLVFIPSGMKAIKGGSLYTVELVQNLGSVLHTKNRKEVIMGAWLKCSFDLSKIPMSNGLTQ